LGFGCGSRAFASVGWAVDRRVSPAKIPIRDGGVSEIAVNLQGADVGVERQFIVELIAFAGFNNQRSTRVPFPGMVVQYFPCVVVVFPTFRLRFVQLVSRLRWQVLEAVNLEE